jgi:hypothetical protein
MSRQGFEDAYTKALILQCKQYNDSFDCRDLLLDGHLLKPIKNGVNWMERQVFVQRIGESRENFSYRLLRGHRQVLADFISGPAAMFEAKLISINLEDPVVGDITEEHVIAEDNLLKGMTDMLNLPDPRRKLPKGA